MGKSIITKNKIAKIFNSVLIVVVLLGNFSAFAQTRRGDVKRNSPPNTGKKIPVPANSKVGWSGVISFTKTRVDNYTSDEPAFGTLDKKNERVKHVQNNNYIYEGKLLVDDSKGTNQPIIKGKVVYTDLTSHKGSVTQWTRCHSHENDRLVRQDDSDMTLAKGEGSGEAKAFDLAVFYEENKYRLSFVLPDAKGTFTREQTVTYSNFCEGKEPFNDKSGGESNLPGMGASEIEGTLDPRQPDVIEGSKTWTDGDEEIKGFTYTVKWKLKRKPMTLMITDVQFFHPLYPSPHSWNEIKENDKTIDGNQVKIVATIANLSGETKTANVQFKELKENDVLPDGTRSETFQPHEEKEIEVYWDTSGYAWKESNTWNQPEIHRQIEVKVPDDVMAKDIEVDPKPVIIIPGLWSKQDSIHKFANFFQNTANTNWTAVVVPVYVNRFSVENMLIVEKTVKEVQKKENAWHVDLIAHSTGGLAARNYIYAMMPMIFDGKPTATHFVMIGTPNMGTPCASESGGIFSKVFDKTPDALKEVTVTNMKLFNEAVTDRKGTKFSTLVGNAFAPICEMDIPGDGVTPSESAIWTIKDWKFSTVKTRHEEMPGEQPNFQLITGWLTIPPKGNHAPDL